MSVLVGRRGTTLAGLLVIGLVLIFAVPYVAHYVTFVMGLIIDSMTDACITSLESSCRFTSYTFTTPFGSVSFRVPQPIGDDVLMTVIQYLTPLLIMVLTLISRPELLAVAFAIDIISYAVEEL
ncbi:MAG: hypothetical protein QXO22_04270 [Thermosphaera sp.]